MANMKIYEIKTAYIDYLSPQAPLLFHNKKPGQKNERKYIGVVLNVNGMDYFAPLSSFKPKHRQLRGLDLIKVKDYAVINLNTMFPVPMGCYEYVNFSEVADAKYRSLLQAEYRFIKAVQERIQKNALTLYNLKVNGPETSLTKRCNDFKKLEELCKEYIDIQMTED